MESASHSKPLPSIFRRPDIWIWLVMAVYLLIGPLIVTHYGATWDEPVRFDYAERSLNVYATGTMGDLTDEKGPFFIMLAYLGAYGLNRIFPGLAVIDGWHFITYLSFLLGVYFFYRLCRRWIEPAPAMAATLLFSTQPVIWGHAFMNPKDMPFMSFFIASAALGLEMAERFQPRPAKVQEELDLLRVEPGHRGGFFRKQWTRLGEILSRQATNWRIAPQSVRRLMIWMAAILVGSILIFPLAQAGLAQVITMAYKAPTSSRLGELFTHIAQNSSRIPVDAYIRKGQTITTWIAAAFWSLLGLAIIVANQMPSASPELIERFRNAQAALRSGVSSFLWNILYDWKGSPLIARIAMTGLIALELAFINLKNPLSITANIMGRIALLVAIVFAASRVFPSSIGRWAAYLLEPPVLLAGVFLGFASDIRTIGPMSGVLVALYLLVKGRHKSILVVLAYLAVGALVTYVFWPYLWHSPLGHYYSSLETAADFSWDNGVLFQGIIHDQGTLSKTYLPTLIALQFTEPAILLTVLGIGFAIVWIWRRANISLDLLLLGIWCVAPIAVAILHHSTVYDNFRQFLFLIPPLFVLAGLALQVLWAFMKRHGWKWIFAPLALACLLPGLYWDVHLHPYEYIYYNALAGNVQGSFRNYENDYWGVSYKECVAYINQVAPQNATIFVYGSFKTPLPYLRPDIQVFQNAEAPDSAEQVDYAIIASKRLKDLTLFPDSKKVFQVTRDGAILSVVKQIQPSDPIVR